LLCLAKGIAVEAYSPLTKGERLKDRKLVAVAEKYSSVGSPRAERSPKLPFGRIISRSGTKSPAQLLIRWALQHGLAVIPKSTDRGRVFENADVFDFEIAPEDMRLLDSFNENLHTCWDPTNAP
jgi:diketogulonate reductase-like aldo/keto reductase